VEQGGGEDIYTQSFPSALWALSAGFLWWGGGSLFIFLFCIHTYIPTSAERRGRKRFNSLAFGSQAAVSLALRGRVIEGGAASGTRGGQSRQSFSGYSKLSPVIHPVFSYARLTLWANLSWTQRSKLLSAFWGEKQYLPRLMQFKWRFALIHRGLFGLAITNATLYYWACCSHLTYHPSSSGFSSIALLQYLILSLSPCLALFFLHHHSVFLFYQ
jgi:hypothetical protein